MTDNTSDLVQIKIPFSGFYYSQHDQAMDWALEQAFMSDRGEIEDREAYQAAFDRTDWRLVHERYAEAYSEAIADECNISGLTFQRLISPREYNFRTDEIICTIPRQELERIYADVDKWKLAELVEKRLKARDGFIPFYSNQLDDWGSFDTWEDPQIDLLIEAYCNEYCDDEWRDCYAMEDFSCNGYLEQWLGEAGAFKGDEVAA